jgi:hypothetical protein
VEEVDSADEFQEPGPESAPSTTHPREKTPPPPPTTPEEEEPTPSTSRQQGLRTSRGKGALMAEAEAWTSDSSSDSEEDVEEEKDTAVS